jgi:hypothetical protein
MDRDRTGGRTSSPGAAGAALREAELRSLERTLRALPEAAMRRERMRERLEQAAPGEAHALLAAVVRRPGAPAPHLRVLREVVQDLLREGGAHRPLSRALRAAMLAEAEARDDAFVVRLLRASGAAAEMVDAETALPRAVAELPLGVRRALARGPELPLLERLLLDADPVVIRHLLANPRITEAHVVRIAARRPIPATTLDAIQRSPRFGTRPRVRVALARNPYCPTRLALALLGVLPLEAVREIARDATLHDETREHARAELARRAAS